MIAASAAPSQDPGSLTYEPYFGLREKPFSLSPDPRFFFGNASIGATFDALVAGIRRREGILALTGEVGTGKTTVCRAVLQSLDRKTFAAFVPDPFLSREDLLKTLLVDFGAVSVDDIRNGRLRRASRADLSYTLYEFFTWLQPLHLFAVVMIDEAQNLPTKLLDEIRILSDLENGQKLLQFLLVGQPELESRLGTPEMRQLTQRLSVRCDLPSLARQDVRPYVSHRLAIAGSSGTLQFTDAAIDLVYEASNGIPRVINLVCDRALLRAAGAGTTTVDAEHILGAVDDLKLPVARTLRAQGDRLGPDLRAARAGTMTVDAEHIPGERDDVELPVARTLRAQGDRLRPDLRAARAGTMTVDAEHSLGERDDVELPVALSSSARDSETPGPNLESLDQAWREAPAEHGQRRPQPQLQGEGRRTLLGSQLGEPRGGRVLEAPDADAAFEEAFAAVAHKPRTRWLALVIALVAVATAAVGYRYWMPAASSQGPDALSRPALPIVPPEPQALPAAPADLVSAAREGEPGRSQNSVSNQAEPIAAALGASADAPSPAQGGPAGSKAPAAGQPRAARFVLQMATFRTATQAEQSLQEFRDAGYRAYSVNVALRDGAPAIAVVLGPYAERAPAEQDLERARQMPGYDTGRIVQIGPRALPTASQP